MEPQQQHPQYRPQPHQPSTSTDSPGGLPHVQNDTAPEPTPGGGQIPAQHDYSFILNPAKPASKRSLLSILPTGGNSMLGRIVIGAGALFAVLVLFVLLKGVIGGNDSIGVPALLGVAQDQQELIHLTAASNSSIQGLSATTTNSRITVQVTITDAQGKLLAYLKQNGQKIKTAQLGLKVDAAADRQLTAATSNGIYNQTYQTVVQIKLAAYKQDLRRAYAGDRGAKGRALLNTDFIGADLLLQQLSSPSS